MSHSEIQASLKVREIMSSPVITVKETDSVEAASRLMRDHEIGSIVIIDETGRPLGMLTERDIVIRVAAENRLPSEVQVKEVMSRPLVTITPDDDVETAAKKMSGSSIRRLAVMERGRLVGIISSKDIVSITPELMELIAHKVRLAPEPEEELLPLTGYCDNCGEWSEELVEVEGNYLCEECRIEMRTEQ